MPKLESAESACCTEAHLPYPQPALKPLHLGGRSLLPIVQGGMGVGVSAHRLAGSVAAQNAVGTISSVDLRRHHPDLMQRTAAFGVGPEAKRSIDDANLEALGREIRLARALSAGRGLLAVNVMRAVSEYAPTVTRALQEGIDAVVVGAGLPLDLPDLAQDHPKAALIPILSDARGVALLVKKWERKRRMPDAIVIEHPRLAGGHLGAAKVADLNDPRFDFENVIPQSLAFLRGAGLEGQVPLIASGGVRSFEDIARLQSLGAAAVQLGTPFAVTLECDAHPNFKRVLAQARIRQRGRPARARCQHPLAAALPAGAAAAAGQDPQEAALHAGLRLPGAMRAARRPARLGPVLHRHPARGRLARRREEGLVFPRRGRAAFRRTHHQRAGTAAALADAEACRPTRDSGLIAAHVAPSGCMARAATTDPLGTSAPGADRAATSGRTRRQLRVAGS